VKDLSSRIFHDISGVFLAVKRCFFPRFVRGFFGEAFQEPFLG
jgi:hypothetical protein